MERKTQINLIYVVLALIGVVLLRDLWVQMQTIEPIPYSRFEQYLDQGLVRDVVVGEDYIRGNFTQPQNGKTQFVTTPVDPRLADRLRGKGIEFTGAIENTWLSTLLSWIVPVLVFFGLWMFVVRRLVEKHGFGGGLMSIGKSKAKIYVETDTKVTFNDVAGVDEAKQELQEVVEFLKNPKEYGRLGARVPKGILLVGPPGTGKTLLARAVAGEAGVPFFSISGSEFVEMFVGVGAARVRDLFEQARAKAPAIIFIDELDALGRARGAVGPVSGNDEREQTLNQLLTELDGFDPTTGLVLLAATNRPEILDPALLRAGRFDRQILVDRPDKTGRIAILNVHLKKIRTAPDVDPEKIAALTTGFSGADLATLVNEAALIATRRKAEAVSMDDFTRAIERIVAGLEKTNRLMNPKEREIVAYHEMGHTIQRPTEDRYLMTREELEDKIAVLLGGRAAEWLVFGHLSTGAADDLAKATDIARSMVVRYGMDEELGFVSYDDRRPGFLGEVSYSNVERQYSEATAEKIDAAVKRVIDRVFDRTMSILERNREILERGARELLARETLTETDLKALAHDLIKARPDGQALDAQSGATLMGAAGE